MTALKAALDVEALPLAADVWYDPDEAKVCNKRGTLRANLTEIAAVHTHRGNCSFAVNLLPQRHTAQCSRRQARQQEQMEVCNRSSRPNTSRMHSLR